MILLTSTSDFILLTTSGSASLVVHAAWMDSSSLSVLPGRQDTTILTPTTTYVVSSPSANTQRDMKTLVISNTSTFGEQITVTHTDSVSPVILVAAWLDGGSTLMWLLKTGWVRMSNQGVKSAA